MSAGSTDPELLRHLQAQDGVDTTLAPSAAEYARHLRETLLDAIGRALGQVGLLEPLADLLQVAAGVVLPLLLVVVISRWLLAGWRRRNSDDQPAVQTSAEPTAVDPEAALRAALQANQARPALAAMWGWVAASLTAAGRGRWSIDQTEREFIETVRATAPGWQGLTELEALRRAVVVGVYGPEVPPIQAVTELLPRARALLEEGRP